MAAASPQPPPSSTAPTAGVLGRARRLLRQQAPVAVVLSELRKGPEQQQQAGGWADWNWQGAMCQSLLADPLDDAFPMAAGYRVHFLRRLSQALEEEGAEEIAEPILRELNSFLLGGGCGGSDSYVTFDCPVRVGPMRTTTTTTATATATTTPLPCRIAPKENQVGLKLWEACFVLADYLLSATRPCLVEGKHVVELGAGVGLLGLIARNCLGARRVTLTDADPEVLQFLRHNVHANGADASVDVAALDWSEPSDYRDLLGAGEGREARVVLAADCIYDREAIPSFVSVLAWALRQDARTEALVASTLRNAETYALFEREVGAQELVMEGLASPTPAVGCDEGDAFARWWVDEAEGRWLYESPFFCPNRAAVRLCRLRLRRAGDQRN